MIRSRMQKRITVITKRKPKHTSHMSYHEVLVINIKAFLARNTIPVAIFCQHMGWSLNDYRRIDVGKRGLDYEEIKRASLTIGVSLPNLLEDPRATRRIAKIVSNVEWDVSILGAMHKLGIIAYTLDILQRLSVA